MKVILWTDPRYHNGRRWDYATRGYIDVARDAGADYRDKPATGRALYAALAAYLGAKHRRPAPSGKTTSITTSTSGPPRGIAVRLYCTDVLTVWPSGRIALDWNGWHTHATNKCMNAYLPAGYRVSGHAEVYLSTRRGVAWVPGDIVNIGARGAVYAATPTTPDPLYADWREARKAGKAAEKARRERNARHSTSIARAWRAALPKRTKRDPLRLIKYLNDDGAGRIVSAYDQSPWVVGAWRDEKVTQPCVGLNASREVADAWSFVQGCIVAEVEAAGRYHEDTRKVTADSMRIVRAWRLTGGGGWATVAPRIPLRAPDWEA